MYIHVYFYFSLFFMIIGFFCIFSKPIILTFDKNKNICTRESQFLFQNQRHIKILCSLSEIKEVKIFGTLYQKRHLSLLLKDGREIFLFMDSFPFIGLVSMQEKIDKYLKLNQSYYPLIIKLNIFKYLGYTWLFIGMVIFYTHM